MNHPELKLTESRPARLPRFLREIEELGGEIGFINAVHETLRRDNIKVDVEGDFERLQGHEDGILFVGDHKNQWEFVALMDLLAQMGRDDMLNIAKFYVKRQVHQALGSAASQLVAPVYPRLLASDRDKPVNSEILNRMLYRKFLLTTEESRHVNERSLLAASERLNDGGVVNIFPVGSVVDARTHPWRSGVGKIIRDIETKKKSDVLVAPYAMDDISRARLVGAVAMRGWGVFGRSQVMNVSLGPIMSANDVIESLPPSLQSDPDAITEQLRQDFCKTF